MEATQSQLPVVLPPLPKLRPRPGHLGATGRGTTNPRPIIDTSPSTIEEKGSTVSKLLMKSEFSRLGDLQVQSANNSTSTRDCTVQRTTYILEKWLKNFLTGSWDLYRQNLDKTVMAGLKHITITWPFWAHLEVIDYNLDQK